MHPKSKKAWNYYSSVYLSGAAVSVAACCAAWYTYRCWRGGNTTAEHGPWGVAWWGPSAETGDTSRTPAGGATEAAAGQGQAAHTHQSTKQLADEAALRQASPASATPATRHDGLAAFATPSASGSAAAATAEPATPLAAPSSPPRGQQCSGGGGAAAAASPASSTTPSPSPGPSSARATPQRSPPINTSRHPPPLDSVGTSAEVAASLKLQYHSRTHGKVQPTYAATCAVLCERHCLKLQDISGELGEPIALDLGCATGGCSFELANSFSHVLGIDGDPLMVVAAKELKEQGQLEQPGAVAGEPAATCVAQVDGDIVRDRVRFWHHAPFPELPPKLQPVDALLLADVQGRLAAGLPRLLQQVPALLNPRGVAVVVLPARGSGGGEAGSSDGGLDVKGLLEGQGLTLVQEVEFGVEVQGGGLYEAHAMVWRASGL